MAVVRKSGLVLIKSVTNNDDRSFELVAASKIHAVLVRDPIDRRAAKAGAARQIYPYSRFVLIGLSAVLATWMRTIDVRIAISLAPAVRTVNGS
jgi:hypothetical protein